jgi:hypothetical protein
MVVLDSNSPVIESARAIEHINIGGVIVQREGRIVGLVTD